MHLLNFFHLDHFEPKHQCFEDRIRFSSLSSLPLLTIYKNFRVHQTGPYIWQYQEPRHPLEQRAHPRISPCCKMPPCRVACPRLRWVRWECDVWTPLRSQSCRTFLRHRRYFKQQRNTVSSVPVEPLPDENKNKK